MTQIYLHMSHVLLKYSFQLNNFEPIVYKTYLKVPSSIKSFLLHPLSSAIIFIALILFRLCLSQPHFPRSRQMDFYLFYLELMSFNSIHALHIYVPILCKSDMWKGSKENEKILNENRFQIWFEFNEIAFNFWVWCVCVCVYVRGCITKNSFLQMSEIYFCNQVP